MSKYTFTKDGTYKVGDEGQLELLSNFAATITTETHYIDDQDTQTVLTLEGMLAGNVKLPPVEITTDQFQSMTWVLGKWGTRAVIQPGSGVKEELRTCIQLNSQPKIVNIYKHLGWTRIDKKLTYLHGHGGINSSGNDESIQVALPPELLRYDLAKPAKKETAIKATLQLLDLGPPELIWPLLAGTFAPLYGAVDFAIHLEGRTGTYKSELLSLFQSHYGKEMDARHLPGSWSSTGNALEAQAHMAKNAVFCIDDFVPTGTSYQVRAYQTTADKIIRAQGNQAGRARLTDTSNLQATMYPRGLIMSSGEDTPEGHSVRARMLILEMAPGDIKTDKLTIAQRNRPLFTGTTAALIQQLATTPVDIRKQASAYRDEHKGVGHSRTPAMLGWLQATVESFLRWAGKPDMVANALLAIYKSGTTQNRYLEAADPVDIFQNAIREVLGAGKAHIRTMNGGVPKKAPLLGWTEESSGNDLPLYKAHGPTIGWIDWQEDLLYIDMAAGFPLIKRAAGHDLSFTQQTIIKRLKDAGELCRVDDNRQRNTVRVTADGHPRNVLCMSISNTLKTEEVPQ